MDERDGGSGSVGATVDVLVIGAGPYGLSTYAHLRRRGLRVRILGQTMHTWQAHMPARMFLKSPAAASNLDAPTPGHGLADYCRAAGFIAPVGDEPVPIGLFVDYGRWFAESLVPVVEAVHVRRVDRCPGGFSVGTASGERFVAGSVVVASGLPGHEYVPAELSTLHRSARVRAGSSASSSVLAAAIGGSPMADTPDPTTGSLSHTSEHTDFSAFADRDVAVIGAGQSALESAALLAEAGARPTVLARRSQVVWGSKPAELDRGARRLLTGPSSPLGPGWVTYACTHGPAVFRHLPDRVRLELVARILGPFGAWWLRERVVGIVPILENHQLLGASVDGDRVALKVRSPGGADLTLRTDHVLAATGYRVGPDALGFLAPHLRASLAVVDGWPRLRADFSSSVPGLYFVGPLAAGSFGPLLRFVCGTSFTSPRVAAALTARSRRPIAGLP
jgi:FAD-dependent urate hydroxylase